MVDIGDTVTDFSEFDESFLMRHAFDNNRKDSSDQLTKKVELPKPQYVNGYRVIPLRISQDACTFLSIYMKCLKDIRVDLLKKMPQNRTLLMLNVPPYVTSESLCVFFKDMKVDSVIFQNYSTSEPSESIVVKGFSEFITNTEAYYFKKAYVTFHEESSIQQAMQLNSIDLFYRKNVRSMMNVGLSLWYNNKMCNYLKENETMDLLSLTARTTIDKNDAEEAERKACKEPDADGWIQVPSRRRPTHIEDDTENAQPSSHRKSLKSMACNDFYAHQFRENQMQQFNMKRHNLAQAKNTVQPSKKKKHDPRTFKP